MNSSNNKGMSLIVKTVTRITLGFILLYGIYIALTGHVAPGGGFAGGVIVALSFVHIMLAFGKDVALKSLRPNLLKILTALGGLIFLVMVVMGGNKVFLGNEIIVPICELTMVGAGLFAIFIALVLIAKADKDSE